MTNENVVFEEVESVEEFSTMEDLAPKFLRSPKVGDKLEVVIKGFNKVTDKSELEFTFEKNGKQKKATNALSSVDFGIKITTQDNATFWVSSWAVFGQIKAIATKLENNSWRNLELQIDHALNGMLEENRDKAWIVRAKVEGAWKQLNKETNDWL